MLDKVSQWVQSSQSAVRPFRRLFALMYIALMSATVVYLNLNHPYQGAFPFNRPTLLAVLAVGLVVIEVWEQHRYGLDVPRDVASILLVGRVMLLAGVSALDVSGVSLFMYPVIPYIAFFAFGLRTSNVLGVACFIFCLWQVSRMDRRWYGTTDILLYLVIASELLIFMQAMASVIHQDEQNRQYQKELLADLAASHRQLEAYAEQVGELAAAEERNRLARDIHDTLGHYLTAINIQLEKAQAYRQRNPAEAEQAIQDAKATAREALEDVRRSVGVLRSADQHFSLREALAEVVGRLKDSPFTIDVSVSGDEEGYSRSALMALYRAAQEGLTNIQKHAQARHVSLEVRLDARQAHLRLADDGQGLDPKGAEQPGAALHDGYGLQGLRERLEVLGGQLWLTSEPEQGAVLNVVVPRRLARPGAASGWQRGR
ncbi:MAG: sensor histidine kinase [Anaerolineales bacterium]|nr:sensor histidine kinase [Anaerolineales bacterium]